MIGWAVAFLAVALVAGLIGFGPQPSASEEVARVIFFIFAVLATIAAIAHVLWGRPPGQTRAEPRRRPTATRRETAMNWDEIKGNWKQMKGRARERWGELTDDDLDRAAGNREQLEGLIQERYGRSKEEAQREVDAWMAES